MRGRLNNPDLFFTKNSDADDHSEGGLAADGDPLNDEAISVMALWEEVPIYINF